MSDDSSVIECEVCGEEWPEIEMEQLNEEHNTYICPNCRDTSSKD